MIKKGFRIKLILILILSSLLILTSCNQFNPNRNDSSSSLEPLIGIANLSNEEKNLIKVGGTDNFYIFRVKNLKDKVKKISCWVDTFEDGKLKNSLGKITTNLQGSDKLKYISIALNKSSIDNTKRELIISIISNTGVSEGRVVDEVDSKLGEASSANQEQKSLKVKTLV